MTNTFHQAQDQFEGKEHQFLDYQNVHIHFIYSFSWDCNAQSWETLCKGFASINPDKSWKRFRIHERTLHLGEFQLTANYQPSLVSTRAVIERSGMILKNATLIIPLEQGFPDSNIKHHKFQFSLGYTIRFFDDGASVCTFFTRFDKEHPDDNLTMFEKIHALLHLARNVDYNFEKNGRDPKKENSIQHLTDAYFIIPVGSLPNDEDWSWFPENSRYCTLHDLFRKFLTDPPSWIFNKATLFKGDLDVLDSKDRNQDFQSPFVVVVSEVEGDSFVRFRKHPTLEGTREVASIMCRLTLDNRRILRDYLHLSKDYITEVLDYDSTRNGLINYCLDRRLFFSFSKRGAIAITPTLKDLPACFVVPSFINLFEIVRGRWHICSILNMRLDNLIESLDLTDSLTHTQTVEKLIELRKAYTRFLRDPVPYLFDGGSVTEIAKRSVTELGIKEISDNVHQKMQILDAIRQDIEEKQLMLRRAKFDEEWGKFKKDLGKHESA